MAKKHGCPCIPLIFITFKTLKQMLPKKENKKWQFMFFNSGATSRSVLAFKMVYSEVLVSYKVLHLQVIFSWPQESSEPVVRVKIYGQNTKTGHNISMP